MIVAVIIAAVALLTVGLVFAIKYLYELRDPKELLVVAGRKGRGLDGRPQGYTLVHAERAVRLPLLERFSRLDLSELIIELDVPKVLTARCVPVSVRGVVAEVRLSGDAPLANLAAERWLTTPRDRLATIIERILAAEVRCLVSMLRAEELRDLALLEDKLVEEASIKLERLGFEIATLRIERVTPRHGSAAPPRRRSP